MRFGDLVRGARLDERDVAAGWKTLLLQRLADRADRCLPDGAEFLARNLRFGPAARGIGGSLPRGVRFYWINSAVGFEGDPSGLDRTQHSYVADPALTRISADR